MNEMTPDSSHYRVSTQHTWSMSQVLLTITRVGSHQKNESLVCKGLATTGLWNILYPVIKMVWLCGGKEAAYSTKGQYCILKRQFQPCFYSLPRTPSGSHGRGSWFKPDTKKACLDGTLRGMTWRGLGQGGDPKCPPAQKQWMTLGPKYRLCVCHLGKPFPSADQGGWVFGKSSGSSPCMPSFAPSVLFFWIRWSIF